MCVQGPEESIPFPGATVLGGWELLDVGVGSELTSVRAASALHH